MPTYTNAQIKEALTTCKGMVYLASKRLGCSHHTILKRVRASPDLQAILESERGQVVDIAEVKLMEALKNNHPWAVAFALRTLGKDRGYVERTEQTGKDGGPVQVEHAIRLRQAAKDLEVFEAESPILRIENGSKGKANGTHAV